MGELWLENKGKKHLEDLGIDGRIILEWILEKKGGYQNRGLMVDIGEGSNEPSLSIKSGEFLD
jgi:hypothetical protein